jgi:hypothetical protein
MLVFIIKIHCDLEFLFPLENFLGQMQQIAENEFLSGYKSLKYFLFKE